VAAERSGLHRQQPGDHVTGRARWAIESSKPKPVPRSGQTTHADGEDEAPSMGSASWGSASAVEEDVSA